MSKQTQMKLATASRRLVALMAVVAVTAWITSAVVTRAGDEPKHDHKHGDHHHGDHAQKDYEKEMAEWMMANQKGPMHDKLKMFAGEWDCKNTMYMPIPGSEPQHSTAESDNSLVYDGRYLRQSYSGVFEMPGPDGKMMKHDFEGYGVLGYDAVQKKFVSVWIDNMSTGIYSETGEWDESAKQFVFHGSMPKPDGSTMRTKSTLKFSGKDKYVFEMNEELAPGKWFKHMEIVYTRDD